MSKPSTLDLSHYRYSEAHSSLNSIVRWTKEFFARKTVSSIYSYLLDFLGERAVTIVESIATV